VTMIVHLDPNDAVACGRSDAHRRTGGLTGVPDAVGDELGHEQAHVIVEPLGRAAVKPMRNERACERWRLRSAGNRRRSDLDQTSPCIL
jgi:hypothetical protein